MKIVKNEKLDDRLIMIEFDEDDIKEKEIDKKMQMR